MKNYKITVEYDGTDFGGWQRQKNARTVQEELERAVSKITTEEVNVIGSGRTDAGVHALGQVANFKTNSRIKPGNLLKGMNSLLPESITVKNIEEVNLKFNARYDQKLKTYKYTIWNSPIRTSLNFKFCHHLAVPLNIKKIRSGSKFLLGEHNFSSFESKSNKGKNSVRELKVIKIDTDEDYINISITGTGFLYNMVRAIVGTLIEVGRGKLEPAEVKHILLKKDRKFAGPTAPAKGLCLMEVKY